MYIHLGAYIVYIHDVYTSRIYLKIPRVYTFIDEIHACIYLEVYTSKSCHQMALAGFKGLPHLDIILNDIHANLSDYPEAILTAIDVFLRILPDEPHHEQLRNILGVFRDDVVEWGKNFSSAMVTLEVFVLINAFRTGDITEAFLFNIFFTS